MARRPRVFIPGYPHHVVQRGHDRKAVFVEPADYEYYSAVLRNQFTGTGRFVDEIEYRTGLRIEARGRGRPPRK